MPKPRPEQDLGSKLEDYFKSYTNKQALSAIVATCLVTFACTGVIYGLSKSILISAIAAALVGLPFFYFILISIVPPKNKLSEFKQLMLHAVQHREAILKSTPDHVIIKCDKGNTQTLAKHERRIWQDIVSPHIITHGMSTGPDVSATPAATEKPYGKTVEPTKMQEELNMLIRFKKRLESEKTEIDRRSLELCEAEDLVVERLNNVEVAEAQLEQLKVEAKEAGNSQSSGALSQRLQAKESEVEKLKAQLSEDRDIVLAQKTELNQLKGELIREFETSPNTTGESPQAELVQKLNQKLQEIESIEEQLKERDCHLTEAENVLIERLDAITEREAHLEQHEVNAGIRKD
ncbi:MAG: hypothetical protein ACSHX8_02500 [Opitutaceae bacterium]